MLMLCYVVVLLDQPHEMPKERARRGARSIHQREPLQCQYPGNCKNERAVKVNGERHWLCKQHRDHQNAMQRERYKRAVKKKTRVKAATESSNSTDEEESPRGQAQSPAPVVKKKTTVKAATESSKSKDGEESPRGQGSQSLAQADTGATCAGPSSPGENSTPELDEERHRSTTATPVEFYRIASDTSSGIVLSELGGFIVVVAVAIAAHYNNLRTFLMVAKDCSKDFRIQATKRLFVLRATPVVDSRHNRDECALVCEISLS
ncbi:hypothetical protein BBJ28_00026372 [Nothophytophthora sp. Chile5]|nr:hypothetical protein BBJ28_00026372 [Nothophytophthora sp. Chile5]